VRTPAAPGFHRADAFHPDVICTECFNRCVAAWEEECEDSLETDETECVYCNKARPSRMRVCSCGEKHCCICVPCYREVYATCIREMGRETEFRPPPILLSPPPPAEEPLSPSYPRSPPPVPADEYPPLPVPVPVPAPAPPTAARPDPLAVLRRAFRLRRIDRAAAPAGPRKLRSYRARKTIGLRRSRSSALPQAPPL